MSDDDEVSVASSQYLDDENDTDIAGAAASQQEKLTVARKEQKAVTWLRVALLVALVLSAIAASLLVYYLTSAQQTAQFENQFSSDAHKILQSVGANFDLTLGATDAFVYKMISYVHYSNSEFPFVTMPNFGVQASKLLSASFAWNLGFIAVVTPDQRLQWENYTRYHSDWVEENLEVQQSDPYYYGGNPELLNITKADYLHDTWWTPIPYNLTPPRLHAANWQTYPTVGSDFLSPYNWDAFEVPWYEAQLLHAMETKHAIMSTVINLLDDPTDPEQQGLYDYIAQWGANFIPKTDDPSEPTSELFYPILNQIIDQVKVDVSDNDNQNDDDQAVGLLFFSMYWRDTIRDILPENSIGLVVVFENSCNQTFTYRVDGAKTTYLGPGDLHDSGYDYLKEIGYLSELIGQSGTYTGLPIDTDFCLTSIRVYPSKAMEDEHVTNEPIIFAVVTAMIFVFTSILFITYDCFVARRQKLVKDQALASGQIVNNLFPDQVRHQMYQEQQQEKQRSGAGTFLATTNNNNNAAGAPRGGRLEGRPNASLYMSTSVFFADLAGFTAWSSKRTPVEVFELLEALYGAFDEVAKRRKVFKVETIGDCYVAVTGIPDPQPNHAIIMVKFARDCMTKTRHVLAELAGSLGEDTLDLDMRVGIHSGATTAGVLRGDKGRFQLFGDTVNTASRMESNGIKGRIHVSPETADELSQGGKHAWLVPREDKITAKGKGEMQTYFVEFGSDSKSVTTMTKSITSRQEQPMDSPVDIAF